MRKKYNKDTYRLRVKNRKPPANVEDPHALVALILYTHTILAAFSTLTVGFILIAAFNRYDF